MKIGLWNAHNQIAIKAEFHSDKILINYFLHNMYNLYYQPICGFRGLIGANIELFLLRVSFREVIGNNLNLDPGYRFLLVKLDFYRYTCTYSLMSAFYTNNDKKNTECTLIRTHPYPYDVPLSVRFLVEMKTLISLNAYLDVYPYPYVVPVSVRFLTELKCTDKGWLRFKICINFYFAFLKKLKFTLSRRFIIGAEI